MTALQSWCSTAVSFPNGGQPQQMHHGDQCKMVDIHPAKRCTSILNSLESQGRKTTAIRGSTVFKTQCTNQNSYQSGDLSLGNEEKGLMKIDLWLLTLKLLHSKDDQEILVRYKYLLVSYTLHNISESCGRRCRKSSCSPVWSLLNPLPFALKNTLWVMVPWMPRGHRTPHYSALLLNALFQNHICRQMCLHSEGMPKPLLPDSFIACGVALSRCA